MLQKIGLPHLIAFLALLLAGCGGGAPPKRIFPPTASIQQLTVQADGQWLLQVRIQNFSNVPHTVSGLSARLLIDGLEAARIELAPGVAIGPQNVEIEDVTIMPPLDAAGRVSAALESGRSVSYLFSGTLTSTLPKKRSDDFSFEGQLWPTPGLPGVLR